MVVGRPGANALLHARRRRAGERREELKMAMASKETLLKYDVDRTYKLEMGEVTEMLKDLFGYSPENDEVKCVMRIVHKRMFRADDQLDAPITTMELAETFAVWHAFMEDKEWVDEIFAKYDIDKSGTLDSEQLKTLLTDLNEGEAPSDEEVARVASSADAVDGVADGVINKLELRAAVAEWYSIKEQSEAAKNSSPESGCCVVQ